LPLDGSGLCGFDWAKLAVMPAAKENTPIMRSTIIERQNLSDDINLQPFGGIYRLDSDCPLLVGINQ
jgi:hypothetical protein